MLTGGRRGAGGQGRKCRERRALCPSVFIDKQVQIVYPLFCLCILVNIAVY